MIPDQTTLVLGGVLLALWLAAAGWALVRGLGMQRRAAFASRRGQQLGAMLETAPQLPLLVRADGRLEGTQGIATMAGLDGLPQDLSALSTDAGEQAAITDALAAAQQAGRPFALVVRHTVSGRCLRISGGPAPAMLDGSGAALLWVEDATDAQRMLSEVQAQRADALAAFEALSSVVEAAPFPMWFRTNDMRLALVNGVYARATEARSAEDVIDQQTELAEPMGGVTAAQAAQQARDVGLPAERLVPVTLEGARRMMRVVDVPIGDIGVAGYAIDQHELDEARTETRRFIDARRAMLDQLSAAVAEFAQDRSLRFVNRPFLRLFGVDEEWAAEAPMFERVLDRLRDNGRTPEVRDFPGWRAERRGWFAAVEAQEESWLMRDGTHLRIIAHPAPDGGLLMIAEDRTEELRLAASRDTLLRVRTATFDNLYEAVAVFAPDGRLHLWNQRFRRLWELPEEYLTTHPRLDALLEKIGERLEEPRQSSVLSQMVMGATSERQQRSGRVALADGRQLDFSAIPLPDGNALFTLIDVTDSRRIERALRDRAEALEDADRVKSDFLSRVSYELRTPLTSINGFAEMLAEGYAGELPETARDYARAILSSTAALSQQIDAVLDLAQSEAGALPLERRPLSLVAMLKDAVKDAQSAAKAADIKIEAQIERSLGQVTGDPRRLKQVFDELLAAAIAGFNGAAEPEGGRRITVNASGDAKQAQIILSDNGPGAAPQGSTAVAVALARQLVLGHDGECTLMHEAGLGSMASVTLPR